MPWWALNLKAPMTVEAEGPEVVWYHGGGSNQPSIKAATEVANVKEAAQYVRRSYRKGWEI